MEVVVRDGEIVKLLEPGQVRRVRAMERTIETPEGAVDGLEVWMEFRGFRAEPEPELRATARGLWEAGKVRIAERSSHDQRGKIGTLLWFNQGVVEVDGKRFGIGPGNLEPLDSPDEPPDPVDANAIEELRMTEAPAEAILLILAVPWNLKTHQRHSYISAIHALTILESSPNIPLHPALRACLIKLFHLTCTMRDSLDSGVLRNDVIEIWRQVRHLVERRNTEH